MDRIISPLIKQGHSPYQIVTNHPGLELSVRTVYSCLDQGLFTARNADLKRKVKFKPRKCHKTQISDRTVFINHTYHDFQALQLTSFVEMDTVHSSYLLIDRGSEFGDPVSLESRINGIQRTSLYYCDPMRSGQKGGLE